MTELTIRSKRIILRPLSEQDAAVLLSYRSHPEVGKFQLWKPVELSDAVDFIKKAKFQTKLINKQWNQFAICLITNNQMVGDIGLLLNGRKAEIGFTIAPDFQKNGLAFEAVTSLISYLFQKHIVSLIIAHTDPNNYSSIRLLNKIGFIEDSAQTDKNDSDLFFYLNEKEK